MKYLSIVALAVLAVVIVTTDYATAQAQPRTTSIFMTKNHNMSKQYPAECRGVIATETLPSKRGDSISWKVKNGNGHDNGDTCEKLDMSQVSLSFKTNVVGAKQLTADKSGSIDGTVVNDAAKGPHGYHVKYKGEDAGPDPEIIVDCDSCGPPPKPPGGH